MQNAHFHRQSVTHLMLYGIFCLLGTLLRGQDAATATSNIKIPPKEIYIYLDISQTIVGAPLSKFALSRQSELNTSVTNFYPPSTTLNRELGTHLQKTINSLVGPENSEDKIAVKFFGPQLTDDTGLIEAKNIGTINGMIGKFMTMTKADGKETTDFKVVLKDIQAISSNRIQGGGVRIFIIVSDFIHETVKKITNENYTEAIKDFSDEIKQFPEDLRLLFDQTERPSHFIFCFRLIDPNQSAKNNPRNNISEAVVKNFEANFSAATKNATEANYLEFIKDRLIQPMKLSIVGMLQRKNSDDLDSILIRITNTNDIPITLLSIKASPDSRAEKYQIPALIPKDNENLFKPGEEREFTIDTDTWYSDFKKGDKDHNHYLVVEQEPIGNSKAKPQGVHTLPGPFYEFRDLRCYRIRLDSPQLLVTCKIVAKGESKNLTFVNLNFTLEDTESEMNINKNLYTELTKKLTISAGEVNSNIKLLFPISENSIIHSKLDKYNLVMERKFENEAQISIKNDTIKSPAIIVKKSLKNQNFLSSLLYDINTLILYIVIFFIMLVFFTTMFSRKSDNKLRAALIINISGVIITITIWWIFNQENVLISTSFIFYIPIVVSLWLYLYVYYYNTILINSDLKIESANFDSSTDLRDYFLRYVKKAFLWALGISFSLALITFLLLYY